MRQVIQYLIQLVKWIPWLLPIFKIILSMVGKIFRPRKKEPSMIRMSSTEQTGLLEALKNVKEWQLFLEEVEQLIITEIKEHKGQPWWAVMLEIVITASTKLAPAGLEAIKDSALIPQECKDATVAEWVTFAVSVLVNQGKIISTIWASSEPAA